MTTAHGDEIQDERSVLVVDDEPGHRLMVRAVLEDNGWRVGEAADGGTALRILRS
ncbi:response regulator, partial [Desulfocurvibacter africanus]